MLSVDWIFIIGAPAWRWLGENVALDRTFYSGLFKQEVVAAPVTATFSPYRIPRGGLSLKYSIVIIIFINYTIIIII